MNERRIVVPKDMLGAACAAASGGIYTPVAEEILIGALRWLAENPIVPTLEQTEQMRHLHHITMHPLTVYQQVAAEWQRRMFLAPETKDSEVDIDRSIKDLIESLLASDKELLNCLREAYRRGRESR